MDKGFYFKDFHTIMMSHDAKVVEEDEESVTIKFQKIAEITGLSDGVKK